MHISTAFIMNTIKLFIFYMICGTEKLSSPKIEFEQEGSCFHEISMF